MKIANLVPGDALKTAFGPAIYIGLMREHPIWPHLSLVIWWLPDEARYSFDALSPMQKVPDIEMDPSRPDRKVNLHEALLRPQQS